MLAPNNLKWVGAEVHLLASDNGVGGYADPATLENVAPIAAELSADVIFQISSMHSMLMVGVEGINWPSGSGSTSRTLFELLIGPLASDDLVPIRTVLCRLPEES